MTDIIGAMSYSPFVAGIVIGGVIWFFVGLAIGWSKGHHAGYERGWQDHEDTHPPRVHNW